MEEIKLNHITVSFDEKKVLDHIDAVFLKHQKHVILGESGVGKTTLVNVMMGLKQPEEGSVEGIDPDHISAVFQEDRLCDQLSAVRNVRMGCADEAERKEDLLKRIHQDLAEIGLKDVMQKQAGVLSGGERRRVSIARCLIRKADVYFFDEALKELDEENRARTISLIQSRTIGKTVFWVSHEKDYDWMKHPWIWSLDQKGLHLLQEGEKEYE